MNESMSHSIHIDDLEIDAAPAGSAGSVIIEIFLIWAAL